VAFKLQAGGYKFSVVALKFIEAYDSNGLALSERPSERNVFSVERK